MPIWKLFSGSQFNQRLEEMHPRLYRVAYSWTHKKDLAEDLVQETLLRALNNSGSLRDIDALDSWLFTIMNNCWRDHLRQLKPEDDIDDVVLTDAMTPEDLRYQHDVTVLVQTAIARLPQSQRQTVTLVDLEGFSYAEVASILDVPIGTVMSRLCRARSTLASELLDLKENQQPENHSGLRRIK